jgi:ketosteroid isomerase-like protein
MSEEKADVIRRALSSFNAEGVSKAAEFWDPEIVWHTDPLVPEPGEYSGIDAVRAYLEGYMRAFGAFRIEIHQIIDLGGDELLAVTTASGHPLGSTDRDTQFLDWCFIQTVRKGKILRIRSFLSKARAFEAAGLSE